MAIPIRGHASAMARTAPRGPLRSAATGVLDWTPSTLAKGAAGARVVRQLPRLRVPHPGWLIAGWIAEMVAKEAYTWMTLWLNGLEFQRFCAVRPSVGFSGGNINCLTGQGPPLPMWRLPQTVASSPDGRYIHVMGLTGIIAGVVFRYGTTQIWRCRSTSHGQARSRPFYAPVIQLRPVTSWQAGHARPGHVPFDVRPWPVWAHARPTTAPSPVPDTDDGLRPPPGYGRWEWTRPNNPPDVDVRPEAPSVVRSPPTTMEREVKIGANTPTARFFFTLMQAREKVSELDDVVGVMFDALPKNIKRRTGRSDHAQRVAVVEYFGQIDWQAFLRGMVANQIEDEIIGRTFFQARGAMRNMVHGNQIGSMGPVNTDGFQEYSSAVSDLSKMLADDMFGPTTREREEATRRAMWKAEKARRDLLRKANQPPPRRRQ